MINMKYQFLNHWNMNIYCKNIIDLFMKGRAFLNVFLHFFLSSLQNYYSSFSGNLYEMGNVTTESISVQTDIIGTCEFLFC